MMVTLEVLPTAPPGRRRHHEPRPALEGLLRLSHDPQPGDNIFTYLGAGPHVTGVAGPGGHHDNRSRCTCMTTSQHTATRQELSP